MAHLQKLVFILYEPNKLFEISKISKIYLSIKTARWSNSAPYLGDMPPNATKLVQFFAPGHPAFPLSRSRFAKFS